MEVLCDGFVSLCIATNGATVRNCTLQSDICYVNLIKWPISVDTWVCTVHNEYVLYLSSCFGIPAILSHPPPFCFCSLPSLLLLPRRPLPGSDVFIYMVCTINCFLYLIGYQIHVFLHLLHYLKLREMYLFICFCNNFRIICDKYLDMEPEVTVCLLMTTI